MPQFNQGGASTLNRGILSSIAGGNNAFTNAADVQVNALENAIPLFQPFLDSGLFGLNNLQQGATPRGLDQILSQIMGTDTFGSLVDERTRSVEGLLSSGGLSRSGAAIEQGAAIPTDIALALQGILSGNNQALANFGFGGASEIGSLTTQVGQAIASGILGQEQSRATSKAASQTNTSNLIGAGIGALFSDPALKQNVRKIKKIGPLDLIQWDWIPQAKGTIVENMPTIGFMSTQIKEFYPQFVGEFAGFDTVDYKKLINELETVSCL